VTPAEPESNPLSGLQITNHLVEVLNKLHHKLASLQGNLNLIT
jgi:hypothetical protein